MINSVLMPLIRREVDSLLTWIAHCPDPGMPCNILFSLDLEWTQQEKETIVNALNASALGGVATPYFIDCEIPESESFYVREAGKAIDLDKHPYGSKSGPNIQFFRSLRRAMDHSFVLGVILMEVDAYPVKHGWLREINVRTGWLENEAYVIGARAEAVPASIKNHLNGNAIYLVRSEGFNQFLDGWEKVLLAAVREAQDLAYDVVLDWHRTITAKDHGADTDRVRRAYEERALEVPRLILNLSNSAGRYKTVCDLAERIEKGGYSVVHGRVIAEGRDLLQEYYRERGTLKCA